MLGRVVVEREQHVDMLGDLGDRLGPLGAVEVLERLHGLERVVLVLGVVDLRKRGLGARLGGLGQRGKNIATDMGL